MGTVVVEGEVRVVWVGDKVGANNQPWEAVCAPFGVPRCAVGDNVVGPVDECVAIRLGAHLYATVGEYVIAGGPPPPRP